MKNKIKSILIVIAAILSGIVCSITIVKYSYYVALGSIAIIVAVASHIMISNLIDKKSE